MSDGMIDYVTLEVDEQLFGLPIAHVQDVFVPERLTRVPLAPADVAGMLNLRGRIVTVIDLRCRLGLSPRLPSAPVMAVGVEWEKESYAILVDAASEVLSLSETACEPCPAHLDPRLAALSQGVVRLDDRLLMMLDIGRVLDFRHAAAA